MQVSWNEHRLFEEKGIWYKTFLRKRPPQQRLTASIKTCLNVIYTILYKRYNLVSLYSNRYYPLKISRYHARLIVHHIFAQSAQFLSLILQWDLSVCFYIKTTQKKWHRHHQEITSVFDNQSATSNSHAQEGLALTQYSYSLAFAAKPAESESLVFSLILVAFFSLLWFKYIVVQIRSCHNSKKSYKELSWMNRTTKAYNQHDCVRLRCLCLSYFTYCWNRELRLFSTRMLDDLLT